MFTRFTNSSNVNTAGLSTGNSAATATYALSAVLARGTVGAQRNWQVGINASLNSAIIPGFKQINGFIGVMLFSRFIKALKKAFEDFLADRRLELWRIADHF
ncbi:MAG: hypothetical protein J5505_01175 [Spirochaetaceae bacterium]|nr:hypothetical protein [Spirochaetaceae bacterium]